MKIIQVHNYYQQAGGEDAVVAAERTLLEEHGHSVVAYYRNNENIAASSSKLLAIGQLLKASVQTIWNHQTYREFRKLLQIEKPDVVHCHNTFPLISPSIYWACSKEKVPVIQTIHNFRMICATPFLYRDGHVCELCVGKIFPYPAVLYRCYRKSRAGSMVWACMVFFHRLIGTWSKKVSAYIALTEFQKHKMIEGGLPEDRIRVKPNFIDDSSMKESTAISSQPSASLPQSSESSAVSVCDTPQTANFQPQTAYCLFVGRLSPEKGCDVLIRAWANYEGKCTANSSKPTTHENHPHLLIVGDGPERSPLEELADSLKLSAVSFLGKQPKERVLSLMRNAQFLVLPSVWYEGFPMTILEAFSQGCPVVASDHGGVSEVLKAGGGCLFPVSSVDDLASALQKGFFNPAWRNHESQSAERIFREKYSADANMLCLMDIYSSYMSR